MSNGLCKIINFQKSQFEGDGKCSFTMNIVIYFERNPGHPNRQFKEYECQIRTRVFAISDRYSRDQW